MHLISFIHRILWNYPLLFLLIITHLYFTWRLRLVQRHVFRGIRLSVFGSPGHAADNSPAPGAFAALMTTLAATLGTGNIIGMSTAVFFGGPGAVFWCWISGVLGMATSYAECYISHHFRSRQSDGTYKGGAMYLFRNTLCKPILGTIYAFFMMLAALLIGCACQSNSIALTSFRAFHIAPSLTGIICALLVGAVLIGGCRIITRVCSVLVPFMAIFYSFCCILLLYLTKDAIQPALKLMFTSAFSIRTTASGFLGGGIGAAIRYGLARGLFTNEAGMGTAAVMAASSSTPTSEAQALISMTGVFWDTVVMCALSGLIILTAYIKNPANMLSYSSGELTLAAFTRLPGGEQLLAVSLILFAISTIIGWFYLGEQALTFLTSSEQTLTIYKCIYLLALFAGALLPVDAIFELTDLCNLFLLLPNIYLLFRLRHCLPDLRHR